jgi:alpha-tubulin suppressor-like RCC1 family protein
MNCQEFQSHSPSHTFHIPLHTSFPTSTQTLQKAGDESVSIRDVICGPTSTAYITTDNTVYTSGGNKFGQLGVGNKNDVMVPTILSPPDSSPLVQNTISQIALGKHMSAIIDTDGYLYTMGYNGNAMSDGVGCLGHGYFPEEYLTDPTLVQSLVEDGCRAQQVVVGNSHMTVLTDEGEVLVAGSGGYGRCGNLDPVDQLFLEPVELLAGETDICQIAGGKDYSLALTKNDGIIFAWGRNHKGQCGSGSGLSVEMYAMESMPVAVEGLLEGRKVVKMAGGQSHAAALTDKGELFTWGAGISVQPELVTALGHTKIVDVACGEDFTIALDHEGKVYSFGKGKTGVLGLASEKKANEPTLVEGMLGRKVKKISASWKHVACLAE